MREAEEWFGTFPRVSGGGPKPFVICVGLVIAERMKESFPLQPNQYTSGGNRFRSTVNLVQSILKRYGESRVLLREGARTTGPAVPAAQRLAFRLNRIPELTRLSVSERASVTADLQAWFAARARDHLDRNPIQPDIDLRKSLTVFVRDLLDAGIQRDRSGAVAQHLVGAKLALRHGPEGIEISNFPFQAADMQTGRHGDFQINSSVFHVTMAPSEGVVIKCQQDLRRGASPILLVPKESVAAAERFLEAKGLSERVFLASIEGFVAQNVAELSQHDRVRLPGALQNLMSEYNRRVAEAETDTSILVEMPDLS
jgi:hypothetical protein